MFEIEPPKPDNPLLKMPHVILSPHNASASARFDPARKRRVGQELALVLGPLADVVRQSDGAAGKRPAALAAGIDGARAERVTRVNRGSAAAIAVADPRSKRLAAQNVLRKYIPTWGKPTLILSP